MSKKTTEDFTGVLTKHIDSYVDGFSSAAKTRVKKPTLNIVEYLNTKNKALNLSEADAISLALREWIDSYYKKNKLTKRTAQDYVNHLFRYMRALTDKGLLTKINYPRVTKNKNTAKSSNSSSGAESAPVDLADTFSYFKFKCPTSSADELGPPHDLSYLEKHRTGDKIAKEFKEYVTGYSSSEQSRTSRIFRKYFAYIEIKHDINNIDLSSSAFMKNNLNDFKNILLLECAKTGKAVSSFNDDWRKFNSIYAHLSHKNIFPKIRFPTPLEKADKLARSLRRTTKLLSMAVRNVKRTNKNGERIKSAYELANTPDDTFLEALERDEHYVFDVIRQAAINEARVAINDFKKGQALIAQCDIDYLRATYKETGELIDPNQRGKNGMNGNHCLSFFSNEHPKGLANLLGWIWHEHNGLALEGAFSGFRQCENHGGIKILKNYLGLHTGNALPFFIVIIGETGVNVTSLERAKIKDENGKNLILVPTEDNEYKRFDTKKPRARKTLSNLVKTNYNHSIISFDENCEVNAYQCLQAVIEMTAKYRNANNSNELWIGPFYKTKPHAPTKMAATAFKSGMAKFVKRNDILRDMDGSYITRANIRIGAGIIKWFESGGNMLAVAKKLGNSPQTALKNYIPQEIQDLLFRREMRRFQNLLILAATSTNTDIRKKAIPELCEEEITSLILQINTDDSINNIDLYKRIVSTSVSTSNKQDINVSFILSEENVAILKLIAESIEESRLAEPEAFNSSDNFSGQPLSYWLELWAAVSYLLRESPDRGKRLTYNNGVSLSNEYLNKFILQDNLGM